MARWIRYEPQTYVFVAFLIIHRVYILTAFIHCCHAASTPRELNTTLQHLERQEPGEISWTSRLFFLSCVNLGYLMSQCHNVAVNRAPQSTEHPALFALCFLSVKVECSTEVCLAGSQWDTHNEWGAGTCAGFKNSSRRLVKLIFPSLREASFCVQRVSDTRQRQWPRPLSALTGAMIL